MLIKSVCHPFRSLPSRHRDSHSHAHHECSAHRHPKLLRRYSQQLSFPSQVRYAIALPYIGQYETYIYHTVHETWASCCIRQSRWLPPQAFHETHSACHSTRPLDLQHHKRPLNIRASLPASPRHQACASLREVQLAARKGKLLHSRQVRQYSIPDPC